MMRLRDRLSSFHGEPGLGALALAEEPRAQRIAHLRALIGSVQLREPAPQLPHAALLEDSKARLPGETLQTASGPLHRIERWLEPEHRHGRVLVRDALAAKSSVLARLALDPSIDGVDLSGMLVLDTETTGLSGGAGTVPFLIGLGWFEQGAFKLEQLFLTNFGGEVPLLRYLAERLSRASCIVTYNGKSFDWPLLRSRFILNRVACPELPLHIDLLHCARRVLKPRLSSVRLVEVERSLLHFHRDDDVDGAEIPGRYLGYLRGRDPALLLPVFEHNAHDVIALTAVLWRLCAHFERVCPGDDPRDHLAYARVAMRAGDLESARAFGEAAAVGGDDDALLGDAFALCAAVARRRGDSESAASLWRRALEVAPCALSAARAHLALTRLYERRLKDIARAHEHALGTLAIEGALAHARRLERLRRRLERAAHGAARKPGTRVACAAE
jgi:uncharacterized protein YprB with RNaseH-like and TPR domain